MASKLIAAGGLRIPAQRRRGGQALRLRDGRPTSPRRSSAQAGVEVDRKDVHLDEPIRSVGTHEVSVRLFADVEPVVTVEVVAQD